MELRKPEEPWQGDLGRDVPPEEWPEIVPSITPIEKVVSKSCKVEATSDRFRLGRV